MRSSMVSLVKRYLTYRRSLGYQLRGDGGVLLSFGRHVDEIGHRGPINTGLVVEWAKRTNSPANRTHRFNIVRDFVEYRALFDRGTEVPPKGMFGPSGNRRPTPHIYSDSEIAKLLKAAAHLRGKERLRPQTFVAMFGLLACTGLRISEALTVTDEDVDLSAGLLTIRDSKFGKSRFVPLHPSATDALARYRQQRNRHLTRARVKPKAFFTDQKGKAIRYHRVETAFKSMRQEMGWDCPERLRLPRVHDLRHTFAVRRLLLWYEEGANIDQKISALATYLGHVNPTKTYWYLTAVPELLAIVGDRFERFCHSQTGGES